ncbi:GAF domain-containing sensor histidine kinase [Archangium violaceum]|uniref:GAF domain-containing sensor histidine kinase n=1 Tax=Archangium violaceum TaxID=83451 RepID=UPI001EF717EA|nr:GAF domain-containing sensor histidine kinase [Archangium violaceum]
MSSERPQSESGRRELLLRALEKLLELQGAELRPTMDNAAQILVELLHADKVDIFFLEPETQTLVARGISDTPMSRKQKRLGLDRLQLANRGRIVEIFETGMPWHTGHQDEDPEELPGIKFGLGIKSAIGAVIEVGGERRGVLECSSDKAEFFSLDDLRFLEAVARWVGVVAHRIELSEQLTKAALEQGRRSAAEDLITIFAHDMGNHLFSLRARIELIHRRSVRQRSVDDIRDAEAALGSVKALSRLTSDLLDVGRLEQGLFSLHPQPLDVMRLVQEVAATSTLPSHEVQSRGPEELVLVADPERLRQALSNLVANALKHSPAGLPVVVEVETRTRTDGDHVVVSVVDQGPGVSPELLPRLFERFARGPKSSGLGLGLYLARRIALAHGGTLEVHSSPGKGARFELSLPVLRDASD